MPQMKPINWMILFLILNLILMFMNIMIFFFKETKYSNINKNFKKNIKNWKW